MSHPLDGARLKFDRGCEHVDTLHECVRRYLKENARGVLDKYEPQLGGYVRMIEGPAIPPEWSVLLGEIAHNFHSCLDHVAWQLAIAFSPTDNAEDGGWPSTEISFPLFACRRKYLRKRSKAWRHNGLLPRHRQCIRRLQPYQRKDAPESHPLWHLYWLSNIDKHQVLHTTLVGLDPSVPGPGAFTREVLDPETGEVQYIYEMPPEAAIPFEGASMDVRLTIGGDSHGDVYFEGDLPFQIEIEQPGTVLHQQPVLRLVDGIRTEVEAALAAFGPLLQTVSI